MALKADPRDIITPDAFSVDPALLGRPLAKPWRRAVAILLDLVVIGLLTQARGLLLAGAASLFFFRIAFRGAGDSRSGFLLRGSFGCLGAMVVFSVITVLWIARISDTQVLLDSESGTSVSLREAGVALSDIGTLLSGSDSAQAEAAAERFVGLLADKGFSPADMTGEVEDLEGVSRAALERAIGALAAEDTTVEGEPPALDSLLAWLLEARAAGDSASIATLRPGIASLVAAPELADRDRDLRQLRRRNQSLTRELGETEVALEAEQNRGLLGSLRKFLDDLGLGIGWSGLYFTFFTGLTRGQTPGKRLLGIRVLRLDGKPVGWWISFERFGGYAAGLLTGLLGFFQILWDRNRQGVHDKLAETVVVRVRRERRSGST